jgi:hypothetical protein
VLRLVSAARCYGHLIRAGVPVGDGAGAGKPAWALQVCFAGCTMTAFGKANPIADLDGIV